MWRPPLLTTMLFGLLLGHAGAEEVLLRNVVDREIKAAWDEHNLKPAARSSDAEFLRRVYLDLLGTIPMHEEVATFLADQSSDKRSVLIDRLLADPRYAQHQADLWDNILFTRNPPGSEADRRDGIQKWLARQFADNVPYHRWVETLLKAEGNSVDDGPPRTSSSIATGRRMPASRSARRFSAFNCSVPAATTTHSNRGPKSTFTAWPPS